MMVCKRHRALREAPIVVNTDMGPQGRPCPHSLKRVTSTGPPPWASARRPSRCTWILIRDLPTRKHDPVPLLPMRY